MSLAIAACSLFNPLDEYGPPKAKPDAGSTTDDATTDDSSSGDAEACPGQMRIPSPPAKDTPGDPNPTAEELVFAAETIDLGVPEDASTPVVTSSFDLDGVCTCPGPPSCVTPSNPKPTCDSDGGGDTAGTELIVRLAQLSQATLDLNRRVREGEGGFLSRLRFYNGGPDDTQVEFAIFVSGGMDGAEVGATKPPQRDGNDAWTIDPRSLLGGTAPPYIPLHFDTKAYVSNGVLVASVEVPLRFPTIAVLLRGSYFTARIVRNPNGTFRLNEGRFVGRWPTNDFLTSLDTTKDPFVPDGGVCGESLLYKDLKKQICAAVDIAADSKLDGKGSTCDALAVTLLFTAGPAKLGTIFQLPSRERKCGNDWVDECPK